MGWALIGRDSTSVEAGTARESHQMDWDPSNVSASGMFYPNPKCTGVGSWTA